MRITVLIYILATLPFLACKETRKSEQVENLEIVDSLNLFEDELPAFGNLADFKVGKSSTYYEFIPVSDSTYSVKWGNENFERFSKSLFHKGYFEKGFKEIFKENWIGIRGHTGSDVWFLIALPLDSTLIEREFWNYLAVDWENSRIVFEKNNELIVSDLTENSRLQKISMLPNCDASILHYCIDSIWFKKEVLYVEWVTPNKIEEPNRKHIKTYDIELK